MGTLVFLGGLAIFLVAVMVVVVGSGVGDRFLPGGIPGIPMPTAGEQGSESLSPQQRIERRVEEKAPGAVAALPAGEVTVSESRINAFLASNMDQLEPLEQATVQFLPGQIAIDLVAMGTENRMTMGVDVVNGRVAVVNAQMQGPLGVMVSADALAGQFEQELNRQLGVQERTVQQVTVQQGQMVVVVE